MALLHAMARTRRRSVALVATFDHGTGAAAEAAAGLVAREAARLGFAVVQGRTAAPSTNEAGWRAERWEFLTSVARDVGGVIVTAHTRDDHIETVLMRVLRLAGARGLAALYAASAITRPLLPFSRDEVGRYAAGAGARWMEDPTNESRAFLRNRVRRDLLPALREVRPAIDYELDDIARRAAAVRSDVERYAEHIASRRADSDALTVDAARLTRHSRAELSLLWPAIASRIGVAMDWRGTERASAFTMQGVVGARMPLSGGWEIARERDRFELRRAKRSPGQQSRLPLAPGARWDAWRFEPAAVAQEGADAWVAQLPLGATLSIRGWRPGDRMRSGGGAGVRRRVKRFLSDARVNGTNRGLWPVVLADDEIVWIPGVRRSDAAAVRPGRPGVLYRCELDRR